MTTNKELTEEQRLLRETHHMVRELHANAENAQPDRLMKIKEVAARYEMSVSTYRRLMAQKLVPEGIEVSPGSRRWHESVVAEDLERRKGKEVSNG